MKIFLKNITKEDLNLLNHFPIQGVIFTIKQNTAETMREIVESLPFYFTILGEIDALPKYEIEELISFCKLQGVILSTSFSEKLSCPLIHRSTILDDYNVLVNKNNIIKAEKKELIDLTANTEEVIALVLTANQFIKHWPIILSFWSKNKVV